MHSGLSGPGVPGEQDIVDYSLSAVRSRVGHERGKRLSDRVSQPGAAGNPE